MKLFLASNSAGRKQLLTEAKIAFETLSHNFDEASLQNSTGDLEKMASDIVKGKFNSLNFKQDQFGSTNNFVLCADTLSQTTKSQEILCKPTDVQDARRMYQIMRAEPITLVTAHYLARVDNYQDVEKICWTSQTEVIFQLEPEFEDAYMKHIPYFMDICPAADVQAFGGQFCKSFKGSYTNVLGLDMFQLRQQLKKMGFKFTY